MTQFIIVYAQSEEESINDSKYITDRVEMLSVFLVGIFFSTLSNSYHKLGVFYGP